MIEEHGHKDFKAVTGSDDSKNLIDLAVQSVLYDDWRLNNVKIALKKFQALILTFCIAV